MRSIRRLAGTSAYPLLVASPLLALLALALSPTIGRAEKPSSEIIYNPKPVPSIESEPKVVPNQPGTPAKDHPVPRTGTQKPAPSANSEAGTAPKATESEGEPGSGEHHPSGAAPPGGGGNRPPGDGGSPVEGATRSVAHTQDHPTPTATDASMSTSGGGSSPVLPILIAVFVLAAVSIGIALYRQRRQGSRPEGYPGV
jgi:hypothetical protein